MRDTTNKSLQDMFFKRIQEYELDWYLIGTEFIKAIPHTDHTEFIFKRPKSGVFLSLLVYGPDFFKTATWTFDPDTGDQVFRP